MRRKNESRGNRLLRTVVMSGAMTSVVLSFGQTMASALVVSGGAVPVTVATENENVSQSGGVAVSNGGCASDGYVNVSATGCAWSGTVDVSGTGTATGGVAASGTGTASGAWASASGTGDATNGRVAVAPDGDARAMDCSAGTNPPVAISGTGDAYAPCGEEVSGGDAAATAVGTVGGAGSVVVGGVAVVDSLIVANAEVPLSDTQALDRAYEMPNVLAPARPYAAAVLAAAEQLGIVDGVDLTADQRRSMDDLADQLLLTSLQTTSSSPVGTVNGAVNPVEATALATIESSAAAKYDDGLNKDEQRVCRNEPYDCWRARDTAPDAAQWTTRLYASYHGHNDRADAFRHCLWNAFMTKRANEGFARRFATAHETGDEKQPYNEYRMDLFNNNIGRNVGVSMEGRNDEDTAMVCHWYAHDGTLQITP